LGLSGPIHSRIRGLGHRKNERNPVLFAHLFVQTLGTIPWQNRQNEHSIHRFMVLYAKIGVYCGLIHMESS
jgi:hypothetical protein